jgi:methylglutaconyl-CoA hydratase
MTIKILQNATVIKRSEFIRVEAFAHGVFQLTLARPSVKNAFHEQMILDITSSLIELAKNQNPSDLRVLLLCAEGSAFSAGADLDFMKAQSLASMSDNKRTALSLARMFHALASFPSPVLATVQGPAIAGATGLLACCDHVIASPTASFALPEVRLGILAATIAPYLLRKVGLGATGSLMLSGRRIFAPEALRIGLVNEVANSESASDLSEMLASQLENFLAASPEAQRRSKALLFTLAPLPTEASIEYTAQQLAEARDTADAREGLTAFFEKRKPAWSLPVVEEKRP